jgi:hypothetical protein
MEGTMAKTQLITDDLAEMLALIEGADSVELKLTVPESSQRSIARALNLDPLDAQIRQVFFFDTPDLALNQVGVVARARRVQGKGDDSVIKLRPVVPAQLPAELRASSDVVVEVDAMPGGYVCSASYKCASTPSPVRNAIQGEGPLRKLFTKQQRAFFAEHAPEGVSLDDLHILGPIFVLKLRFSPADYSRGKIVAELWLYPDGSRILELSTKCAPADAIATALDVRAYLQRQGVDLGGDQQTKTKTALEFFAGELAEQA